MKIPVNFINMKTLITLIKIFFACFFFGWAINEIFPPIEEVEEELIEIEEIEESIPDPEPENLEWFTVTATYYNPVSSQCSGNPLITASGKKIDLEKLRKGHIRWIAVSRDLLKIFNYGDTVYIECNHDPSIEGEYVVVDTMHERHKRKIDLLWPSGKTGKGVWKNVRLAKKC